MAAIDLIFGAGAAGAQRAEENKPVMVGMADLSAYAFTNNSYVNAPAAYNDWTGDKFAGGFGETQLYAMDYWTLRQRSAQLFTSNMYARGIVRRLVTNEINTGLNLEASPEESIIGVPTDSLQEWAEDVEIRHSLWGAARHVCDFQGLQTYGELQRTARRESIIEGDVLVVLRTSQKYKTTEVQLISGSMVRSPSITDATTIPEGHEVIDGVELNAKGQHVAFWIVQRDGSIKRQIAVGPRSGRTIAWLVYGTDKRHNAVRGEPLLAILLQSLREIDRYRDSAQRKAVINSLLAMFITKGTDKPGTLPFSAGARKADKATITDNGVVSPRTYAAVNNIPGIVVEELQEGEEIHAHGSTGTDVNFPVFESAIVRAMAWAIEVPPEIIELSFSNNYSASQAAINEFKIYLNMVREMFGGNFNQPIYRDWFLSSVLNGVIDAPGFLQAWNVPLKYDIVEAWMTAEWAGQIKPSTDIKKQAQGYQLLLDMGAITRDRTSRELTGTKFSKNVKRQRRENEQLVEAQKPLAEADAQFNNNIQSGDTGIAAEAILDRLDQLEEMING